MSMYS